MIGVDLNEHVGEETRGDKEVIGRYDVKERKVGRKKEIVEFQEESEINCTL